MDPNSWKSLLNKVINDIMEWLPSLIGALTLIFIGWLAAFLIRLLLQSVLKRVGVDKIAQKSGAIKVLNSWGVQRDLSRLIAMFAFWIIFLLFLLAATESLGLNFVSDIFQSIVKYLPKILGALLIVLAGGFIAGIIGDASGSYATRSGVKTGSFIGKIVKITILVFVVIIAIQQLGVETALLSNVIIVFFAAFALSQAIAFGIGTREMAHNIISGFHARETFVPGSQIKVRNHTGKLIRIGTYKFIVETASGRISLPNHILSDEEITILPEEK